MRSLSLCSTRLMLLRSKFRILKFEVQSPMSEVGGRGKSHADDPLPSFRSPIAASQILWGSEIRCHEERNTRSLSFYTHTHFCVRAALFCRVQRGPSVAVKIRARKKNENRGPKGCGCGGRIRWPMAAENSLWLLLLLFPRC